MHEVNEAQIVVRGGMARMDAKHAPVALRGLGKFTEFPPNITEIEVSVRVIGLQTHSLLKARNGVCRAFPQNMSDTEVGVRIGVVWTQA